MADTGLLQIKEKKLAEHLDQIEAIEEKIKQAKNSGDLEEMQVAILELQDIFTSEDVAAEKLHGPLLSANIELNRMREKRLFGFLQVEPVDIDSIEMAQIHLEGIENEMIGVRDDIDELLSSNRLQTETDDTEDESQYEEDELELENIFGQGFVIDTKSFEGTAASLRRLALNADTLDIDESDIGILKDAMSALVEIFPDKEGIKRKMEAIIKTAEERLAERLLAQEKPENEPAPPTEAKGDLTAAEAKAQLATMFKPLDDKADKQEEVPVPRLTTTRLAKSLEKLSQDELGMIIKQVQVKVDKARSELKEGSTPGAAMIGREGDLKKLKTYYEAKYGENIETEEVKPTTSPELPKTDKPKTESAKETKERQIGINESWELVKDSPEFTELVETIRVLKKNYKKAKEQGLLDDYEKLARKHLGIQSLGRDRIRNDIINYLQASSCAYMLKGFPGNDGQRKALLKEMLNATNADRTEAGVKSTLTDELANLKEHIRLAKGGDKPPKTGTEEKVAPEPPELPKSKPVEYPSSMPESLQKVVDSLAKDNKEKELFITAWRINKSELNTVSPDIKRDIGNQISAITRVSGVRTDNGFREMSEKVLALKSVVKNAMKVFADVLDEKAEETLNKAIEAQELKEVLLVVVYKHDDLKEKIERLFAILSINPSRYKDPQRRGFFVELQNEIRTILFDEVPAEMTKGIKSGTSVKARIEKIKKLGLREKKKKIEALRTKLSELDDELEYFNDIEQERLAAMTANQSSVPEQPIPLTTPSIPAEAVASTEFVDPGASTEAAAENGTASSSGESVDTETASTTNTPKTRPSTRRTPETLKSVNEKIQIIMNEVLADRTMYGIEGKDVDPASLAIQFLIQGESGLLKDYKNKKKIDLAALKGFLQKPGLSVDTETEKLNSENTLDELQSMLTDQEREYKRKEDEIKTLRGRMNVRGVTEDERKSIEKKINEDLYPELHAADDQRNRIKTAINLKNGTMRYNSTSQVLAMIRLFISNSNNEHLSQINLLNKVDTLINAQKENMPGTLGKGLMEMFSLGGVLKPTLTATLKALEKDPQLAKIGSVKLVELAKAHKNRGAVETWVATIEGAEDYKMTKVVPRLIAYLETALRNGNVSHINIASKGKIRALLEHLKAIRHEYITDKVDKMTAGKNMSDVDIMSTYFKELDKVTVDQSKIEKSIITRHSKLQVAKRLAKGAGIGALGGLGILGGVAAAPLTAGILGAGGATHYLLKSYGQKDEDAQKKYRKSALRIGWTGALATGAMALNPLLAPVALAGVFSPELGKLFKFAHKKRDKINKVAGTTAKSGLKATKWGTPKAMGIPEVGFRALISASSAFTIPWLYKKVTGRSFYLPRWSMAINNALNKKK